MVTAEEIPSLKETISPDKPFQGYMRYNTICLYIYGIQTAQTQ